MLLWEKCSFPTTMSTKWHHRLPVWDQDSCCLSSVVPKEPLPLKPISTLSLQRWKIFASSMATTTSSTLTQLTGTYPILFLDIHLPWQLLNWTNGVNYAFLYLVILLFKDRYLGLLLAVMVVDLFDEIFLQPPLLFLCKLWFSLATLEIQFLLNQNMNVCDLYFSLHWHLSQIYLIKWTFLIVF